MFAAQRKLLVGLLAALLVSLASAGAAAAAPPVIRVAGSQLVDASGAPLRITGVNRSGSEYACAQGWGMFDGPVDDASIASIAAIGANAVRVPLNEDCWLGINGVNPAYAGSNYQSAVRTFVQRLQAHGLAVILDLHWGAPGSQRALDQETAPDAEHAPAFWSSVAAQYKAVSGVAFDLFNEPHDISWACWRSGCTTPAGWQATGMQQLIDAVRGAGAGQPVIAEGLAWGGDLSGWLANQPTDPSGQLVAGWHIYNFSGCNTTACWDSTVAPVAAHVPVMATEVGESDCAGGFLGSLLPWADSHRIGYVAWAWNSASCTGGPSLISDYSGTLTSFGAAYRDHLSALPAPLDPAARFDFEDGSAHGWGVWWGGTVSVSNETPKAASGSHGLALDVSGTGWPAVGTGNGIGDVGPGTVVTYRVWAPAGVAAGVSPALFDSAWNAVVLGNHELQPGWNTLTFTIPVTTNGVKCLGLQVNDGGGWAGRLVLDDVTWKVPPVDPAARYDFEDGTSQGWGVSWGNTLSVSQETGTGYSGPSGLALDVSGTGWPATGVGGAGLSGAGAGSVVTYHVWAPAGVSAGVSPMLFDSGWRAAVMANQDLQPGWNTVNFTIPPGAGAVKVLGLQVNDGSGWVGRLALDDVTWSAAAAGGVTPGPSPSTTSTSSTSSVASLVAGPPAAKAANVPTSTAAQSRASVHVATHPAAHTVARKSTRPAAHHGRHRPGRAPTTARPHVSR